MTLAAERSSVGAGPLSETLTQGLSPRALGRVLVTGGSSGLGAAIVEAVAASGGEPVVLDLNAPLRDGVLHERVDLTNGRATEAAVRRVAAGGPIASVVTAAGIDACGPLDS